MNVLKYPCLCFFSVVEIAKYFVKSSVKEKGFILDHRSRSISFLVRKSRHKDLEVADHIVSIISEHRKQWYMVYAAVHFQVVITAPKIPLWNSTKDHLR